MCLIFPSLQIHFIAKIEAWTVFKMQLLPFFPLSKVGSKAHNFCFMMPCFRNAKGLLFGGVLLYNKNKFVVPIVAFPICHFFVLFYILPYIQ